MVVMMEKEGAKVPYFYKKKKILKNHFRRKSIQVEIEKKADLDQLQILTSWKMFV
jgi:hypothetical protein